MISSTFLIVPLILAASAVARPTQPLVRRATSDVRLSEWASHSPPLESYWTFKNRFGALGCASQQGTDFYTSCCYPLDATESLSGRPAECTPAGSTCGASVQAVTPSSSSSSSAPAYTPPTNTGTTTNNNSNDDSDDDEDLPVCEDPNDDGEWHDGDENAYTYSSESTATTSSYTPAPTTSEAPQQTTPDNNTDNSNSGNTGGGTTGEQYTGGVATYFWQGGNAGACGNYHADTDLIAALDTRMFGTDYSHPSSWCGVRVRVVNTDSGASVDVMIQDACPSCNTATSLDLSHGAFLAIAKEEQGQVPISWSVLN